MYYNASMVEQLTAAAKREQLSGKETFVLHGVTISMYVGDTHVGDIDIEKSNSFKNADLISEFEILSPYRGNGYGRRLLKYALSRSRSRYQVAYVYPANTRAKHLFTSFGFKDTGKRETDERGTVLLLFKRDRYHL